MIKFKFYNGKLIEMVSRINCLEKMVSEIGTVKYIGDDITINIPATSDFNLLTHKLLIYADILFTEEYSKNNYTKAIVSRNQAVSNTAQIH